MKRAFFTQALPCECCGEPTTRPRIWNAQHEIWIAADCICNLPTAAPCLIPEIESAHSVSEVSRILRTHRKTCMRCRPQEIRSQPHQPRKAA